MDSALTRGTIPTLGDSGIISQWEESMASQLQPAEWVPGLKARELPPEEFAALSRHPPFSEFGLPSPSNTRVAVVEEGGEVVAFCPIWLTLHTEPLWISPLHRKKPGMVRRIWGQVLRILFDIRERSQGAFGGVAYAIIYDQDQEVVGSMAERLGFKKVPASLYMLEP